MRGPLKLDHWYGVTSGPSRSKTVIWATTINIPPTFGHTKGPIAIMIPQITADPLLAESELIFLSFKMTLTPNYFSVKWMVLRITF